MATHDGKTRRRLSLDTPPSMSSDETSLRMLVFSSSSLDQISLIHSVLGPGIFNSDDVNISATVKRSEIVQERNITLVNLPNLKKKDLKDRTLHKELRKAVCFSCPGPHAVLFILDPYHMTSDILDIAKPVIHHFGESILKHMLVVLYHEKAPRSISLEDEVKKNNNFRELAEKCGQNYIFFNEEMNRTEQSQTHALCAKVDEMVSEHGIFANPEYKDAEKRIKREEGFIRKSREKEIIQKLKELENEHSGEELISEKMKYENKVRLESREMAELDVADKLGFTLRLVDYAAAIGKGAIGGALVGFAVGYDGMWIGAAVGAGIGGIVGGAVNAAWSIMAHSFSEVRRGAI